jgi:outer membrane protein
MKRTLVALMVLVTVAGANVANAGAGLKIAILDGQAVLAKTDASQRALVELQKQTQEAQTKINEMEKELLDRRKELESQRSVLSAEKLAEAESQLRADFTKFRAEAQKIQEQLDRSTMSMRRNIADEIHAVVKEMAKAKGYDLVLPKQAPIFSNDKLDITDEVLEAVNKRLNAKK